MNTETTLANVEVAESDASLKNFDTYKAHILDRVVRAEVGRTPFHHLYIEGIFPDELYAAINGRAAHHQRHAPLLPRLQDNRAFTNSRFSLVDDQDVETRYVRDLFSDADIKAALVKKFFLRPERELIDMLRIHEEFEYVYTAKDRFQNIHVDVPAKFLSLVFYLPDVEPSEEQQRLNATVLYDKNLQPHHLARYRGNSVCIFAPHFYSYHGFATTMDRTALVMFYVDKALIEEHQRIVREAKAANRLEAFKDTIQSKLEAYPILEYGASANRIVSERKHCLVNAPRGRVMRDEDK